MAKRVKTSSNKRSSSMQGGLLPHTRTNPVTGTLDYYFPLEITDASVITYATENGYKIGMTRFGCRVIRAAMIPCIRSEDAERGIVTTEKEQHRIYNDLMKDELARQDRQKNDGRCSFIDENGLRVRCPYRCDNPNFDPTRPHNRKMNSKTVRVRCENCKYFRFKAEHDFMPFSAFEREDESGNLIPFDAAAPETDLLEDDSLDPDFKATILQYKPHLDEFLDLLAAGLTQAEAAAVQRLTPSTVNSRVKALERLIRTNPKLRDFAHSYGYL